MTELYDLLPLHALGVLDPDDAARVEAALARDPALRLELASFRATVAELAMSRNC